MSKVYVKVVHLHTGSPALGGKLSLQATKNNTLEVTPEGIKAVSKASKRCILIPYSNVVDCELYYQEAAQPAKPVDNG
jgi:hypothetical protein